MRAYLHIIYTHILIKNPAKRGLLFHRKSYNLRLCICHASEYSDCGKYINIQFLYRYVHCNKLMSDNPRRSTAMWSATHCNMLQDTAKTSEQEDGIGEESSKNIEFCTQESWHFVTNQMWHYGRKYT